MEKNSCSRRKFFNHLGISFVSFCGIFKIKKSPVYTRTNEIFPPRPSVLTTSDKNSKSTVIIVEGQDIEKMMRTGMEALKLPDTLFKDKKVVIKPNTHWSETYPSTTDPVSLVPVIDFLRERKSGNITVADGSGKDLPDYRSAFEFIGFKEILESKGVDVNPLDIWELDDFITVQNQTWNVIRSLAVHRFIYNAPILISMTCLKRHGSPRMTAALKNNIGAISARARYNVHYRFRNNVREAIAEIADAVRPDISIIDARDILIKDGPGFLQDRSNLKRGVNRLLLSTDVAALDSIAARVMAEHDDTFQLEAFQPTLDHAYELELGNIDSSKIDVVTVRI